MRQIEASAMEDVAIGGAVLGTGGGGDPYIGKLMAIEAIKRHQPVELVDVDELNDDDLVVTAAMMGAPTVMVEKLPQGQEIVIAFKKLEAFLGKPIRAVLCAEAGGLNSTTPFIVAAETGLPLVDGDSMGRAFPELQMVTFSLHGISSTPMVMADDKGNSVVLSTISNPWTERLARSATIDMGGAAMIALYPCDGATAKKSVIRGTISLIETIGKAIREARAANQPPVEVVKAVTGARELFRAKVTDVSRRTEGGFAKGEAILSGIDDDSGHTYSLSFQNEFLVAQRDGDMLITVPDLITLLDVDTGEPITTESLRFGFRVVALGIPCDPQWRTPEGLELVGPRYFGYDVDYIPIEERALG
ncbi:MAG: DUF917 domain-containing protein [Deinococcota bacterium]